MYTYINIHPYKNIDVYIHTHIPKEQVRVRII